MNRSMKQITEIVAYGYGKMGFNLFLVLSSLFFTLYSDPAKCEIVPKNHNGLPVIILKMDDLINYKYPKSTKDEARWDRFVSYIQAKGLKVNIGAIGSYFETASDVDRAFVRDVQRDILATEVVELFNHSFCYCPDSFGEASNYQQQYEVLDQAQAAVKNALGITMVGFGSGANKKTADTVRVMNNHPDMKVWLFGRDDYADVALNKSKVLNLTRRWRYDNLDEIESVDSFLAGFENIKASPFMVYQGHAGKWSRGQFSMFKQSINALLDKYPGIKFMTISEYYQYLLEN